jgi:hypothetical protein
MATATPAGTKGAGISIVMVASSVCRLMVTTGVGEGVGVGIEGRPGVGWPLEVGCAAEAVVVAPDVRSVVGVTGDWHAAKTASTIKGKARNGWVTAPYPMLGS